jgi:hypothetical protein
MVFGKLRQTLTGKSDKCKSRASTFNESASGPSSTPQVLQGYVLCQDGESNPGSSFMTIRSALILRDPQVVFYAPWDRPTQDLQMTGMNVTLARSRDASDFTVVTDGYTIRVHEPTDEETRASVAQGILASGHITDEQKSQFSWWAPKTVVIEQQPGSYGR